MAPHGYSHLEKAPQVRGYFFYIVHTVTPTKAKLKARADKSNANKTTNGGGLEWTRINTHYSNVVHIILMCIQCGRMQRALLRIIMRIVGLVWTGLN